jgi:hypothetical protein
MFRELCVCICLALIPEATRAANKPHVAADAQAVKICTNDDLDRLHHLGLISIVGPIRLAQSASEFVPQRNETTRDPAWYADEASGLRVELEQRQLQLRNYQKAILDAQSFKAMTGGINLASDDFAITPEAGAARQ